MDSNGVSKPKFSAVQVLEGASAAILAAAVIGTAGGVGWLIVRLPHELSRLERALMQVRDSQRGFESRFTRLEETVDQQDRRIIRLELKP